MLTRLGALGALLAMLWAAAPVAAEPLQGPRLAFIRWSLHPESVEIISTDALGREGQTIVGRHAYRTPTPYPFLAPAWSPDDSRIAFTGLTGPFPPHGGALPSMIFVTPALGGPIEAIPGTVGGYQPVFSPDGQALAFTRQREHRRKNNHGGEDRVYESAAVWLLDLATGASRQLTPWRNHLVNVASSFAPDGKLLAISHREGAGGAELVAVNLDSGGSSVLTRNGLEPQYSPDGSRIAFLRGHTRVFRKRRREGHTTYESKVTTTVTDLFVMRADGSGVDRLTDTPNVAEGSASWDPSGSRLAYIRSEVGTDAGFLGFGNSIMEMNPDGSCPRLVLSDVGLALFGPVWEPGPGRGIGRIAC